MLSLPATLMLEPLILLRNHYTNQAVILSPFNDSPGLKTIILKVSSRCKVFFILRETSMYLHVIKTRDALRKMKELQELTNNHKLEDGE